MDDNHSRHKKRRRTLLTLGVVFLVATPLTVLVASGVEQVRDAADRSH
jgi:hypothetical protein